MLRWVAYIISLTILISFLTVGGGVWVFWNYGRDLPDYRQLENYTPPITTRVHAGDGSLLEE